MNDNKKCIKRLSISLNYQKSLLTWEDLCKEKQWDFDSACGCGSGNQRAQIYASYHAALKPY